MIIWVVTGFCLYLRYMDRNNDMTTGVVISTYNNPEWLEKTLLGYMSQSCKADEIIIADDGSTDDTRKLIERYSTHLPIIHVWHEDNGFRKTEILNKAISAATADYLIFTDQDCIPRRDFIETHRRYAREGYFLSGGYFKLPMDISRDITPDDIASGRAFDLKWLRSRGLKCSFKCSKLVKSKPFTMLMNRITPARASWNGCNSSVWRKDILKANGFDERMRYGGEDREFGERLVNSGMKSRQIRYSAILLHLDHNRPYKNEEAIEINRAIRRETKATRRMRTQFGIDKE